MIKDVNRMWLYNNIIYLQKEKGIKMSELEADAGVSTGYISRIKAKDKVKLDLDVIYNIARGLDVSIDLLVKTDLTGPTPSETLLIKFLEALAEETRNDKLYWKRESKDADLAYIPEQGIGVDLHKIHPLFTGELYYEQVDRDVYPEERYRPVFYSTTYGSETCVNGDCFNMEIPENNTTLYLMDICKKNCKPGDTAAYAKEIWLCESTGKTTYLCSDKDDKTYWAVRDLHTTVKAYFGHSPLTPHIRNIIENFMNSRNKDKSKKDI